jgi:hypothetical protein
MSTRSNIVDKLKGSLHEERDIVKEKLTELESKVQKANHIFEKHDSSKETPDKVSDTKKVRRDTFTFPDDDHFLIKSTLDRLMQLSIMSNKSEVIRAGLHVLSNLSDKELSNAIGKMQKIKVGRPSQ